MHLNFFFFFCTHPAQQFSIHQLGDAKLRRREDFLALITSFWRLQFVQLLSSDSGIVPVFENILIFFVAVVGIKPVDVSILQLLT